MECFGIYTASLQHSKAIQYNQRQNFKFNLQLFSGEKTEEATPKRRDEARKKGQVAKSIEVNSAFVILAAFFTLKLMGTHIYDVLTSYMRAVFTAIPSTELTIPTLQVMFIQFATVIAKASLPVMGVIVVVSLAVNFMQVGFIFTVEPLTPDLSKLNPISGLTRLFSVRSLVELGKAIFKVVIIGYFIYHFVIKETPQLPKLMTLDIQTSLSYICSIILDLAFQISAIMIVIAAIDYFFQWRQHNESLKMSKQEVKEEFKQTEGNPQIKGKIREKQRAVAMRRMMQEVPKASVVVTNPTHFAVALQYDKDMPAPVVIAKGQDFIAAKIKEVAKQNNVVIVENKPLARALFAVADIGQSIPADLFQAVAEVLAHVYRLKKKLS